MLVLKSRDTSLLDSEKRTLRSFFILYILFSFVIIVFSSIIYYNSQKELMFEKQNSQLKRYSSKLIKDLEYMHKNFYDGIKYPRYKNFKSAIYDSSGKLIFSTLEQNNVNLELTIYNTHDKTHYIRLLNSFYLGAMYVVIEIENNFINSFYIRTIFFGIVLFSIFLIAGYFLLRLLLKPMRESLHLLDRFIKDTTHELNTPVSSILANIEMIDRDKMVEKNLKKLKRIEVAAKTISTIYEDLTYVALGNKSKNRDEDIDLKELLKERGEFFKTLAESKKITISYDLKGSYIYMDRGKMVRVIDNLLSNAIKYNKSRGNIMIASTKNSFSIEDSGIGIAKEDLSKICQRYARFNDSEGGFGIGLSIVSAIIDEYKMKIEIKSELNRGTKVSLIW